LDEPDKAVEIFTKYTGIKDLTEEEIKAIEKAVKYTKDEEEFSSPNGLYNPSWFGFVFADILSKRTRIGWSSYAHTGQPVILTAGGPGANSFMGFYDNTDVAKKMASLWGITLKSMPVKK